MAKGRLDKLAVVYRAYTYSPEYEGFIDAAKKRKRDTVAGNRRKRRRLRTNRRLGRFD